MAYSMVSDYAGSFTPYGYIKDPKNIHQLIAGPEAADLPDVPARQNTGWAEPAKDVHKKPWAQPLSSMIKILIRL